MVIVQIKTGEFLGHYSRTRGVTGDCPSKLGHRVMLSLSIQVPGPREHTEPQSSAAPHDSVLSFRVAGLTGEGVQTRQDVAGKRS